MHSAKSNSEKNPRKWEQPQPKHLVPTKWNWVVAYPETLFLGKRVDIGCFCFIQAEAGVIIGSDVQIGAFTAIYSVSTINDKRGSVTIKKGCRIGAHSLIMPSVIVGEGAIVGAYSYVDRDIPPYSKGWGQPWQQKTGLSKA